MARPCGVAVILRRLPPAARIGVSALGGLAVLALYVLAIWRAPEFLVNQDLLAKTAPEQRLPAEHNARLIVISVGGALVVGTGLLYTARNYRLAHRGQVTERFTKALERLGSDELYVRIGGVHALEHVMRDSPDHHGDVVEVLVAFVRDRAPRRIAESADEVQWMHPPIGTDTPAPPDEPASDVQAALTALGKRPNRVKRERSPINLRQLHLKGAVLDEARLDEADLSGAQLEGAILWRAQLREADLSEAQLQHADFTEAQLQHAGLQEAQLQRADLRFAQLQGARLLGTQLQRADLWEANLEGACLLGAQLQGAELIRTKLQGADLRGADLQGAKLYGMNLVNTAVSAEQLRGAVLREDTTLPQGFSRGPLGEIWEKKPASPPSAPNTGQRQPTP